METETAAGIERPLFANIEIPVTGNVVNILNTVTVAFHFLTTRIHFWCGQKDPMISLLEAKSWYGIGITIPLVGS
jgi:hypothetical protein